MIEKNIYCITYVKYEAELCPKLLRVEKCSQFLLYCILF